MNLGSSNKAHMEKLKFKSIDPYMCDGGDVTHATSMDTRICSANLAGAATAGKAVNLFHWGELVSMLQTALQRAIEFSGSQHWKNVIALACHKAGFFMGRWATPPQAMVIERWRGPQLPCGMVGRRRLEEG